MKPILGWVPWWDEVFTGGSPAGPPSQPPPLGRFHLSCTHPWAHHWDPQLRANPWAHHWDLLGNSNISSLATSRRALQGAGHLCRHPRVDLRCHRGISFETSTKAWPTECGRSTAGFGQAKKGWGTVPRAGGKITEWSKHRKKKKEFPMGKQNPEKKGSQGKASTEDLLPAAQW